MSTIKNGSLISLLTKKQNIYRIKDFHAINELFCPVEICRFYILLQFAKL